MVQWYDTISALYGNRMLYNMENVIRCGAVCRTYD